MYIETDDPNVIGEFLRRKFFQGEGLGCYQTFTLADHVQPLDYKLVIIDDDSCTEKYVYSDKFPTGYQLIPGNNIMEVWTRGSLAIGNDVVIMEYYWDGDGILKFIMNERILENSDCKKTRNWEWL